MPKNSSPKARKSSAFQYLSVKNVSMYDLMNNLILIKRMQQCNLIKLNPTSLENLQSYQKMMKTISGYLSQTNENSVNYQKRKSHLRVQRDTRLRSPLKQKQKVDHKKQQQFYGLQKIEARKLTELEANKLFRSLFSEIQASIKQWLMDYRLNTSDMIALMTKYKLTDDFLSKKSYDAIEEIMQKNGNSLKQKSEVFINTPLNLLFEQKKQFICEPVGILLIKAQQIFKSLNFTNYFLKQNNLSQKELNIKGLLLTICQEYQIVPYHNFTHGFAVFASFYDIAQINSVSKHFDDFSLFFSLIACISHDIGHPGNNTLFEVKVQSDLAIEYCNISVMEKMHLSKTMQILSRNPKTNKLYQSLSQPDQIRARKIISRAILATDMMRHYNFLERLQKSVQNMKEGKNIQDQQQQNMLTMEVLIHCCDIENPSFQYDCYLEWANLVCLQFHMQATKQSVLGIQVTPFMKFDSLTYFYKNQISFVNSTVLPIWQCLQNRYENLREKGISSSIKHNLQLLTGAIRRNSQRTEPVTINTIINRAQRIQQFVGGRLQDYLSIQKKIQQINQNKF